MHSTAAQWLSAQRAQNVRSGAAVRAESTPKLARGGSVEAVRSGELPLLGIVIASTDASWERKLVDGRSALDRGLELPLAARDALVELLVADLATAPPEDSESVSCALQILGAAAPEQGIRADGHALTRARAALEHAGLLGLDPGAR